MAKNKINIKSSKKRSLQKYLGSKKEKKIPIIRKRKYQEGGDIYDAELQEVEVTDQAPNWLKYKREYQKNNPIDIEALVENRFNNPIGREAIEKIDAKGWKEKLRKQLLEEYSSKGKEYVSQKLAKNNPRGNKSRGEWIDSFSAKEQKFLTSNPNYQPTLWQDTKRGFSISANRAETIRNIANSKDYSVNEKKELFDQYVKSPNLTELAEISKVLSPLSVGSKIVQSTYKDDYSFSDALRGTKNNASSIEDMMTDPLNLVGLGIWAKLSQTGKFAKLSDAYNAVKSLPVNKQKEALEEMVTLYRVQEKNFPNAEKWSLSPNTEFIIPKDLIAKAQKYDKSDWNKLIENHYNTNNPTSILSPVKAPKPAWQLQELPGLHLKSTSSAGELGKIVEQKTGLIPVEQALNIIAKRESGGVEKAALIKKALGDNIPKKMDYNDFRKIVQDQLIPLDRSFTSHKSDFGFDGLGYPKRIDISDFENVINEYKNSLFPLDPEGLSAQNLKKMQDEYDELVNRQPLENQTLMLSNKKKFGTGSNEHDNPSETLGHIHLLRDKSNPNTLTITQIQSDFFQKQENYNALLKSELENFPQKKLLGQKHQDRFLQEIVDYAGSRNDIDNIRIPTRDTAVKIQGYTKKNILNSDKAIGDQEYLGFKRAIDDAKAEFNKYADELAEIADSKKPQDIAKNKELLSKTNRATEKISKLTTEYDEWALMRDDLFTKDYSSSHKTILKKYDNLPNLVKKYYGIEPSLVKDHLGNEWYEFAIPKYVKEGKHEIQAFRDGGSISKYQTGGYKGNPIEYRAMSNVLLNRHQDKDFVQRIANPYLTDPLYRPNGDTSTHSMRAERDANHNWYVFPEVVNKNGTLVDMGDNAMDYALNNNQYIPVPTANLALWMSNNGYKKTPFANGNFKYQKGGSVYRDDLVPSKTKLQTKVDNTRTKLLRGNDKDYYQEAIVKPKQKELDEKGITSEYASRYRSGESERVIKGLVEYQYGQTRIKQDTDYKNIDFPWEINRFDPSALEGSTTSKHNEAPLNLMFGIPQPDSPIFANKITLPKLSISKYRPSKSYEDFPYYFSISNEGNYLGEEYDFVQNKKLLEYGINNLEIGENQIRNSNLNLRPSKDVAKQGLSKSHLGRFTVGRGKDDKGDYISYYDEWDLDPQKGGFYPEEGGRVTVRNIFGNRPLKEVQAELDTVAKGKYVVKLDEEGQIYVGKKTKGNVKTLNDIEKFIYNWQSPTSLRTGDAQGNSKYVKQILDYYNKIGTSKK